MKGFRDTTVGIPVLQVVGQIESHAVPGPRDTQNDITVRLTLSMGRMSVACGSGNVTPIREPKVSCSDGEVEGERGRKIYHKIIKALAFIVTLATVLAKQLPSMSILPYYWCLAMSIASPTLRKTNCPPRKTSSPPIEFRRSQKFSPRQLSPSTRFENLSHSAVKFCTLRRLSSVLVD